MIRRELILIFFPAEQVVTKEKMAGEGKKVRVGRDLLWLSTLGINLVLASAVGVVVGHFLDKWLKTGAIFTILFFFIGTFAGFRQIFKEVQKLNAEDKDPDGKKK